MKKTRASYKPENSSVKIIESIRQSHKYKDLIQKANHFENSNRGISETKMHFNKVKNVNTKQTKKSEEPCLRILDDKSRGKSGERRDNSCHKSNDHNIKINVLYHNNNFNLSNNKKDQTKPGQNSNRSSKNLLDNSKLNISLAGLITNTNNVNVSPKQEDNVTTTTTNFSKFAHQAKHVKSKSISSNRGILSSLNMLKIKKEAHKSKNESSYNNISFENTKENIINNTNKSTNFVILDHNGMTEHSRGHVRSYSNASNSLNNQKSTNKGSTTSSITKLPINNQNIKNIEIDSPEELHYFYVSLFIQNKNLAYKFENLNFSAEFEINDIEI
jgi:hypothetical protein